MNLDCILSHANQKFFTQQYQKLISQTTENLPPVLLVNGGCIKLHYNGIVLEEINDYYPLIYKRLKEFSHLFVAIYLLEKNGNDHNSRKELVGVLGYTLTKIVDLEQSLKHPHLSETATKNLIFDVISFITILKEYLTDAENNNFILLNKKIRPYLDNFIEIAEDLAQVELHSHIEIIKSRWNNIWNDIFIIVSNRSSHLIGDINMEYFAKLSEKENKRIIYNENMITDQDALQLITIDNVTKNIQKEMLHNNTTDSFAF